jgi:predicted nuclease of predicted toxin-antitoxin system
MDVVRVQDVGLRTADDPAILAWAAVEGRVVVTRDHSTLIGFAYARVKAGLPMPGVLAIRHGASPGAVLGDIAVADGAGRPEDFNGLVRFLPF